MLSFQVTMRQPIMVKRFHSDFMHCKLCRSQLTLSFLWQNHPFVHAGGIILWLMLIPLINLFHSNAILRRYTNEDVLLTFPSDLSVHDVQFIGLWCVAARQNFGHLSISSEVIANIPPYVPPTMVRRLRIYRSKFIIMSQTSCEMNPEKRVVSWHSEVAE